MLKIKKYEQNSMILYRIEELVPKDSLYRKIDQYIDFTFIYDEVKDLYCSNNGRYSIDPVVLFKLVFIQALDGLEYIKEKFGFKIKEVGVDSGYDTIDIKKYFEDNEIFGVIAYRRYQHGETKVRKYDFKYNKEADCYICPKTGVTLEYTGRIDRNGYKNYLNKENCKGCPHIEECCKKQGYGYRYAMYRGAKKNQNYTWLICATQNMKNIALKLTKVMA